MAQLQRQHSAVAYASALQVGQRRRAGVGVAATAVGGWRVLVVAVAGVAGVVALGVALVVVLVLVLA